MNAAAKALANSNWAQGNLFGLRLTKSGLMVLVLVFSVLLSALAVVYVKNLNRRLFSTLQTEQQTHDRLQVQWAQLLLEQSTWATQARVQRVAINKLHMIMPPANDIKIISVDTAPQSLLASQTANNI